MYMYRQHVSDNLNLLHTIEGSKKQSSKCEKGKTDTQKEVAQKKLISRSVMVFIYCAASTMKQELKTTRAKIDRCYVEISKYGNGVLLEYVSRFMSSCDDIGDSHNNPFCARKKSTTVTKFQARGTTLMHKTTLDDGSMAYHQEQQINTLHMSD